MAYLMSCPNCGQQLAPVALDPQAAPWLCAVCSRGWWVSELSVVARVGWDHRTCSFQWSVLRGTVAPARVAEWLSAEARGTSLLPEQFMLVTVAQLARAAADPRVSASYAAQIEAAITARKTVV